MAELTCKQKSARTKSKNATLTIKCDNCGIKFKRLKCHINRTDFKIKHHFCCIKCYWNFKKGKPNIGCAGKQRPYMKGKLHPNWKDGRTEYPSDKIRKSYKWKIWRTKVFKRDKYTCQLCNKKGGELHPHHMKFKSLFPKLVFVVKNGQTLCKKCHMRLHRR